VAIPAGTTVSYGQLAGHLGENRASRAVGAANGANPIAIVVPCHRVIRANGGLTGYAGGLLRKQRLLEHEASFSTPAACERTAEFADWECARGVYVCRG
jgi:methylated-DNA-[protein]-cysteine S-methyltransferase